jgi:hypothetical protein
MTSNPQGRPQPRQTWRRVFSCRTRNSHLHHQMPISPGFLEGTGTFCSHHCQQEVCVEPYHGAQPAAHPCTRTERSPRERHATEATCCKHSLFCCPASPTSQCSDAGHLDARVCVCCWRWPLLPVVLICAACNPNLAIRHHSSKFLQRNQKHNDIGGARGGSSMRAAAQSVTRTALQGGAPRKWHDESIHKESQRSHHRLIVTHLTGPMVPECSKLDRCRKRSHHGAHGWRYHNMAQWCQQQVGAIHNCHCASLAHSRVLY